MRTARTTVAVLMACLFVAVSLCRAQSQIELKPEGYFETPGFAFLVYHNTYFMGKRGGLEVFLHGRRVIDAGEVICVSPAGQVLDYEAKETGARVVDVQKKLSIIPEKFKVNGISYRLVCSTDGASILMRVVLDNPVDWKAVRSLGLKLEIFTKEYVSRTYRAGKTTGIFPDRFLGTLGLADGVKEILVAPEDPQRALTFSSDDAVLSLSDGRNAGEGTGFIVTASLPPGSARKEFSLKLTPLIDPDWRKTPVIQVSQVGYHPDQPKLAVLEVDSRTQGVWEMKVAALKKDGSRKDVKVGKPVRWGGLFDNNYYTFDFSEVKAPGQYFVRYEGQEAGPIVIDTSVYREAWRPTLDVFFPVQMCHVDVRQGDRVWHGACHLDDALQAPPNTVLFDDYKQKAETETRFKANEHVPGLDWGGWHDAGDYDLPTGSICQTLNWLSLAKEEFGIERDVTSIRRETRRVTLYTPDGKDDLLQQIAFGMEWLLGVYRAAGHVSAGVIENKIEDYVVVGDPVNITDGMVYDARLKPTEKKDGRSGMFDDRWIFTNRNTGGQYQLVQTAAICSRVLREYDRGLADECLKAAREIWDYEQTHPRVDFEVTYQPQEDATHSWEMTAAAELFLTTGEEKYRTRLAELEPFVGKMPVETFGNLSGFTLARAAAKMGEGTFKGAVAAKARELKKWTETEFAKSPYGVAFEFYIWGNNWDVLDFAARAYFFVKHFPEIFPKDCLLNAVNYNFGCHPATNHSYVSGVGINSATVGYGFNRADETYIPGGVVSGASFLRPKFIEYRACEWDWYETEYVIGGSAAYLFDVLAADALLNKK